MDFNFDVSEFDFVFDEFRVVVFLSPALICLSFNLFSEFNVDFCSRFMLICFGLLFLIVSFNLA